VLPAGDEFTIFYLHFNLNEMSCDEKKRVIEKALYAIDMTSREVVLYDVTYEKFMRYLINSTSLQGRRTMRNANFTRLIFVKNVTCLWSGRNPSKNKLACATILGGKASFEHRESGEADSKIKSR